jgi:toxin ParE1/3/4
LIGTIELPSEVRRLDVQKIRGRVIASRKLIVSDAAKTDLDGIFDFIAVDSPDAAGRVISGLVASMLKIARTGSTGVPRDWVSPGLRAHIYKKYAIYFRVTPDALTVIRVLHGSRDIDSAIFDVKG